MVSEVDIKTCIKCGEHKPTTEYHINKRTKGGFNNTCKVCKNAYGKEHYRANTDKYHAKSKRWREENREGYRAIINKWQANNLHVWAEAQQKRRAKMDTPLYRNNKSEIIEIYKHRPAGYHVDHIVPINGTDVCGLHVPWNLQYLPAQENIKKGNKHGLSC